MLELETLHCISYPPADYATHCLALLGRFFHFAGDDEIAHLCLVTGVLGGSVDSLMRTYPGRGLPIPLAKHILNHMLMGLIHAHKRGVVHTGKEELFLKTLPHFGHRSQAR